MKKKVLLSVVSICVCFSSCKKKDNSTSNPGTKTSATQPYCVLTALRSFSYSSGSLLFNTNTAYAEFRSDINSISTDMQIGGVFVSGKKLKYQSSDKTYQDTTNALSIIPTTWQVIGTSPIPSFTYTNNDSLPTYTGYAVLPDTIYKNQPLNLQINGISNSGLINVLISDNSTAHNSANQSKSVGISTNNTLSFSVSSLSGLVANSSVPGWLSVSVMRYNAHFISGVNVSFASQLEINKSVYIK